MNDQPVNPIKISEDPEHTRFTVIRPRRRRNPCRRLVYGNTIGNTLVSGALAYGIVKLVNWLTEDK